jgi:hypothetical protein
MNRENWIQARAYNIWCEQGWPIGRDKEHWAQAAEEAKSVFNGSGDIQPPTESAPMQATDEAPRASTKRQRAA